MTFLPSAITAATAFSMRSAASRSPRWRSMSMPESIIAVGLALFWPLYLGASRAWLEQRGLAAVVGAGRDAEAADEAGGEVGDDVAVEVRQHQHVVQLGLLHELHAHVVDDAILELDVACSPRRPRARRAARGRRCAS